MAARPSRRPRKRKSPERADKGPKDAVEALAGVALGSWLTGLDKRSHDAVKALEKMRGGDAAKKGRLEKVLDTAKTLAKETAGLLGALVIIDNVTEILEEIEKRKAIDSAYKRERHEILNRYADRGYRFMFRDAKAKDGDKAYRKAEVHVVNKVNGGYAKVDIDMRTQTPAFLVKGERITNRLANINDNQLVAALEESLNLGLDHRSTIATAGAYQRIDEARSSTNLPNISGGKVTMEADGRIAIQLPNGEDGWDIKEAVTSDMIVRKGGYLNIYIDADLVADTLHAPANLRDEANGTDLLFARYNGATHQDEYSGAMINKGGEILFKFPSGSGLQSAEFVRKTAD